MIPTKPNIIQLAEDWRGETAINLFVDGHDIWHDLKDPPQGYPPTFDLTVGGQLKRYPCAYLWKDVLVPGSYYKQATGQELQLSTDRLERMSQTFKKFIGNGNTCPIVYKDHKEDRSVGFCIDCRVREGRLELLHQFIGEDAALNAVRNRVSPQINRHHTDSKNNTYEDCIVHNSLTSDPVIIGQRGWESMAASRGEPSVPSLYVFAASRRSDMDIASLRRLLGLADSVPEAEVLKKAHERLSGMATLETEKTALTAEKTTLSNTIATKDTEITNLRTELATEKGKLVTLSNRMEKRKPSAQELFLGRKALAGERATLIASGKISVAGAKALEERLIGKVDLDTITLSREVKDEDIALSEGIGRTIEVYEALGSNTKAPGTGGDSKTGNQSGNEPAKGEKVVDDKNKDEGQKEEEGDDKEKKGPKNSKEVMSAFMTRRYKGPANLRREAANK